MGQLTVAKQRLLAWAGLAAGPAAWLAHHQIGSDLNYAHCQAGDGRTVALIGAAAFLIVLIGAGLAGAAWRAAGKTDPSTRFLAALALMGCALFGLTILMQIGAGLIVPACFQ